ncbi:MAG: hypothetical protein IE889_07215 [Campylobacterales bacterium]|nr:hypothetical protein [Campylobacterales bacterium]
MSNQETLNYKATLCREIQAYTGFTETEKQLGKAFVESEVDQYGNLTGLIDKFKAISLDIRPFIEERGLAKA